MSSYKELRNGKGELIRKRVKIQNKPIYYDKTIDAIIICAKPNSTCEISREIKKNIIKNIIEFI